MRKKSLQTYGRRPLRPRADILRFFDGFDLIDPGLVYLPEWRARRG